MATLMAGPTAIEVGTANLVNPRASLDILEGLKEYFQKENISTIRELVGAARK